MPKQSYDRFSTCPAHHSALVSCTAVKIQSQPCTLARVVMATRPDCTELGLIPVDSQQAHLRKQKKATGRLGSGCCSRSFVSAFFVIVCLGPWLDLVAFVGWMRCAAALICLAGAVANLDSIWT